MKTGAEPPATDTILIPSPLLITPTHHPTAHTKTGASPPTSFSLRTLAPACGLRGPVTLGEGPKTRHQQQRGRSSLNLSSALRLPYALFAGSAAQDNAPQQHKQLATPSPSPPPTSLRRPLPELTPSLASSWDMDFLRPSLEKYQAGWHSGPLSVALVFHLCIVKVSSP
ncbi:hypothetical protein V8E36_004851 [Tilletia maclaganii]